MRDELHIAFLHDGGQGGWAWNETVAALRLQAGTRVLHVSQRGTSASTPAIRQ